MGKRFLRTNEDAVVAGVCGGIAEYFGLDAKKIRIAWLISILFFGTGLMVYVILAIIMPRKNY